MASRASRTLVRVGRVAFLASVVALVPRAEAAGPFRFFSVPPCRRVDTRNANGPVGGPKLNANSARSFPTLGSCGISATAKAVVFNVTVTEPTDFGDIRIFPADAITMPLVSTINWVTSDFAVANGAIVPVGPNAGNDVTVQVDMPVASMGQVHLILDVTGYFE